MASLDSTLDSTVRVASSWFSRGRSTAARITLAAAFLVGAGALVFQAPAVEASPHGHGDGHHRGHRGDHKLFDDDGKLIESRFQRRLDYLREEIEDDLELRPEQKPALDNLMAKIEAFQRARIASRQRMRAEQHTLSEGTFDIDRWAAYQKTVQQKRSVAFPQAEWEAMIDARVAFYKTLDAEQQAEVREHFTKRFRHHGH